MSGYDYRSKPVYAADSHHDYAKGRPIISYDVARGTRSYVTRTEARVASQTNYGRPREVEDFITQILDEVNGVPGLAFSPDSGPNWGLHNSYPSREYGSNYYPGGSPKKSKIPWEYGDPYEHRDHVYDQLPQRDYVIPDKEYMKPNYEAPKQWDRSTHHVDDPWIQYKSPTKFKDYEAPKTRSQGDDEVRRNQWDKSSSPVYDDRSPNSYEVPSNHWDRLSSYDQPPPNGNASGASKSYGKPKPLSPYNYGSSYNQLDRSSSPVNDLPISNGNTSGVPSSRWGNSSLKPQSPKGYGVSNNWWDRPSSPIRDYFSPTKNTEGVSGNPSSRWDNSSMKPQSFKDYEAPNKQWDRPSSPVCDHPSSTNIGAPNVRSSRWGDSLAKPQTPKGYGVPDKQWNRSSSPNHDQPPPTKNTEGFPTVPSSRWGNSVNPQSPKDHGGHKNQWDRSLNPSQDHPPPTKDQWNRSLSPNRDHPPSQAGGAINNQWPKSPVKAQSVMDYGAPNRQWNKQSNFPHDRLPLSGNIGGAPDNRLSDPPAKPQSPRGGYNQYNRSSSPVHDNPAPVWNTTGVPNSRFSNPSVNPQYPKVTSSPYDQQIGNSNGDLQSSKPKPVDYSYDHRQPKDYTSSSGVKPSGKVTNTDVEEAMPKLKITTGRSPDYLKGS